MDVKLFDSELKVMEVLWELEELSARDIVEILTKRVGWNKNTTYTVIKKCIDKGAIERREPGIIWKRNVGFNCLTFLIVAFTVGIIIVALVLFLKKKQLSKNS